MLDVLLYAFTIGVLFQIVNAEPCRTPLYVLAGGAGLGGLAALVALPIGYAIRDTAYHPSLVPWTIGNLSLVGAMLLVNRYDDYRFAQAMQLRDSRPQRSQPAKLKLKRQDPCGDCNNVMY
jgi:hypothetical protein